MFGLIEILALKLGGDFSADIISLLCLVTSRSNEKLSEFSRLNSKQSVKLSVVEGVISSFGIDGAPASKLTSSELEKFLNLDDCFLDDSHKTLRSKDF